MSRWAGHFLRPGFLFYLAGGFGAGDGKLAAVAGLWVGPDPLGGFLLAMAVCASGLGLAGAVLRGSFLGRGPPVRLGHRAASRPGAHSRIGIPVW